MIATFADMYARQLDADLTKSWLFHYAKRPAYDPTEWERNIVPIAQSIHGYQWIEDAKERDRVRSAVGGCLAVVFSKAFKPNEIPETAFDTFVDWLEQQTKAAIVTFYWTAAASPRQRNYIPRRLRRSPRLVGPTSPAKIGLAIAVAREAEAMELWPKERWSIGDWERDSQPYRYLIENSASYLVRTAAAKAFGALFAHLAGPDHYLEAFMWIQRQEAILPGVAGPFLQGADGPSPESRWDSIRSSVDLGRWMLDTLRLSAKEPEVLFFMSLEFYASEYFWADPKGIRELLAMGRNRTALLAATDDDRIPDSFRPFLEELAQSSDPRIARFIQGYLADPNDYEPLDTFFPA